MEAKWTFPSMSIFWNLRKKFEKTSLRLTQSQTWFLWKVRLHKNGCINLWKDVLHRYLHRCHLCIFYKIMVRTILYKTILYGLQLVCLWNVFNNFLIMVSNWGNFSLCVHASVHFFFENPCSQFLEEWFYKILL